MEIMSVKEAAEQWGISTRRVEVLCSLDRIENAQRIGGVWVIPFSAVKPVDARTTRYEAVDAKGIKPFLKWAGGKGQLLEEIRKRYPFDDSHIRKYAEPFVGGGAVLFDVLEHYSLDEIFINDINKDLIDTYQTIKENCSELLKWLGRYQDEYVPQDNEVRKDIYLRNRRRFNELKAKYADKEEVIEKSALFIFLNKTCFNGLYRVNRKGEYNVPMGAYKNPLICDEKNLSSVSEKLQNVSIHHGDYWQAEDFVDELTFVYFDPPYRPLTVTASFTSYTENAFDDEEQKRLAEFAKFVDGKGARFMLSNSDPKNANQNDNFFDDLYCGFNICRVKATRMINSKSSARGKISELLITNY